MKVFSTNGINGDERIVPEAGNNKDDADHNACSQRKGMRSRTVTLRDDTCAFRYLVELEP